MVLIYDKLCPVMSVTIFLIGKYIWKLKKTIGVPTLLTFGHNLLKRSGS